MNKIVVKKLLMSEKASRLKEVANQYVFEVDRGANKLEIRRAVEQQFNVKVQDVNTMTRPGKAKRSKADEAERKLLVGLAHDRIIHLGMVYIDRGYITQDEYENLQVYLYEPYAEMGGNGSAKRVMEEVRKLPIR